MHRLMLRFSYGFAISSFIESQVLLPCGWRRASHGPMYTQDLLDSLLACLPFAEGLFALQLLHPATLKIFVSWLLQSMQSVKSLRMRF